MEPLKTCTCKRRLLAVLVRIPDKTPYVIFYCEVCDGGMRAMILAHQTEGK